MTTRGLLVLGSVTGANLALAASPTWRRRHPDATKAIVLASCGVVALFVFFRNAATITPADIAPGSP